jgi:hypothetical protein
MRFTYVSHHAGCHSGFDVTTRSVDVAAKFDEGDFVKIYDNRIGGEADKSFVQQANTQDDLEGFVCAQERVAAWTTKEGGKIEHTISNMKTMPEAVTPVMSSPHAGPKIFPKWDPLKALDGFCPKSDEHRPEAIEVLKKDAINPSHYQGYVQELQWLETMQYLPNFREPTSFKAAVELQLRKYLDRNGKKDNELQELEKAAWYLRFLIAYVKNDDSPIRVNDIPAIMAAPRNEWPSKT